MEGIANFGKVCERPVEIGHLSAHEVPDNLNLLLTANEPRELNRQPGRVRRFGLQRRKVSLRHIRVADLEQTLRMLPQDWREAVRYKNAAAFYDLPLPA